MPSNLKNYHQIYSSALHEMRDQARREKIKSKSKSREKQKYHKILKDKEKHRDEEEMFEEFQEMPAIHP
jgi:hypothetical protein